MPDDEPDWQKNVKPIKCDKIIIKADQKINVKPLDHKKYNNFSNATGNLFDINSSYSIDYNTKSKIDRGKYFISDRLDLHGYNIEDAYYKFTDFIIKNYQVGNRCVLVITGYGSATNKAETIKSNLYKWLNDIKIQHMILYHQQAKEKHGGKGAFYILLRRNKDDRLLA